MYSLLLFLLIVTSIFVIAINAVIIGLVLFITSCLSKETYYLHLEKDKNHPKYERHFNKVATDYVITLVVYLISPWVLNLATGKLLIDNCQSVIFTYGLLLIAMIATWITTWFIYKEKEEKIALQKQLMINTPKPVPYPHNRQLILQKRKERMSKHFTVKRGEK